MVPTSAASGACSGCERRSVVCCLRWSRHRPPPRSRAVAEGDGRQLDTDVRLPIPPPGRRDGHGLLGIVLIDGPFPARVGAVSQAFSAWLSSSSRERSRAAFARSCAADAQSPGGTPARNWALGFGLDDDREVRAIRLDRVVGQVLHRRAHIDRRGLAGRADADRTDLDRQRGGRRARLRGPAGTSPDAPLVGVRLRTGPDETSRFRGRRSPLRLPVPASRWSSTRSPPAARVREPPGCRRRTPQPPP